MAAKCPNCHSDNPETLKFCGECGTQLPSSKKVHPEATETLQTPIHELTTGSAFAGRYQIIEELGKGGMGRVYRVLDKKLNEEVVLKLINPEIGLDKKTIERFSNELKLSRKIVHKNVARMFDLNEEKGTHYITMEYVQGEDLRRLIRKMGILSPGQAMPIARQVCEGLVEAHRLGVVHRDLKPSNVMIDEEGNARIMDFGIALSLSGKGITDAGMIIGTPEYMSPEQVEGKQTDPRSDIYSLGVILYEMVTGRTPFEGDTPFTIGVKHKSEIPRDPRELNTQIPPDLGRLVLKCLEKDRAKRYQSAEELHADLGKVEQGLPTTERVVPARKPFTSKETTAKFSLRKLLFPSLAIVVLVIAAGIILWRILSKEEGVSAKAAPPSIAVLPFEDWSQAKNKEDLCDGISETLINALTNIEGLWVPARTSAFFFKGKTQDIREIGQKLGVENVLEGSVQVAGDNLRVTARISNVQDGRQVWSQIYNRKMADMFAIQDDIANAIVTALKIKLLGDQQERLVKRYTENMEAYKHYLEGLHYWNKRTGKDLNKAIELFNQAIEEDPNYALAFVGLADSYSLLGTYADARPKDVFPRAKVAAIKALEIDESLAEAHNSLAYVYERYDWDLRAAEAQFRRALELNPNYATAHFWYGELLTFLGRPEEAIREMKRALELDPISLIISTMLGWAYLMARQPDQALVHLYETVEMDPHFALTHYMLGRGNLANKDFSAAIDEMKKARELSGGAVLMVSGLGEAYAGAGKLEEAKGILEELKARSQKQFVSPFRMAVIYVAMGDLDKAFELVNKAYEERDENLIFAKPDPSLAPLHSDPRYAALLKKMGLD